MTAPHSPAARFRLTLVEMLGEGAGSVPALVRLRRALKVLRRTYGLRCTSIKETGGGRDARR